MMHKMCGNRFMLILMMLVLSIGNLSMAQSNEITLSKTAEYDIGFYCPVASTLNPIKTEIWVLMDNCGGSHYQIFVYRVEDGTQVEMYNYQDELAPMGLSDEDYSYYTWVIFDTNPMAFTPDGDLSIRYYRYDETDSGETVVSGYRVLIPVASEGDVILEQTASLDALLREYTEYFEFAVYNDNHTQVAIWDDATVHIVDLATETEVADIAAAGEPDYTRLWFSADGLNLYAFRLNDPDNWDDASTTLAIYSLPEGDLLNEYAISSNFAALSPDGTLAAVNSQSNDGESSELFILDLATGEMSSAISLYEPRRRVTTCLNTGRDMSDVEFYATGRYYTPAFHWLDNNTTIVAAFSYGGESGGGSGEPCIFDYSRLRDYTVSIDG